MHRHRVGEGVWRSGGDTISRQRDRSIRLTQDKHPEPRNLEFVLVLLARPAPAIGAPRSNGLAFESSQNLPVQDRRKRRHTGHRCVSEQLNPQLW